MPRIAEITTLFQLAATRFGNISPAEKRLFEATEIGESANCADLSIEDRLIRGRVLSWICINTEAGSRMTHRGISIDGAEIDGPVDLAWARIPFPVLANRCVFRDQINLDHSRVLCLSLSGSSIKGLKATYAVFEDGVVFNEGFRALDEVDISSSTIGGNLECDGGVFVGWDKSLALNANGAKIGGGVYLYNNFKAYRGVDLVAATIGGCLECRGGQFEGDMMSQTPALNANSAKIGIGTFLRDGFRATGGVDLRGATIDGTLECDRGVFVARNKRYALDANSAQIKGGVYMREGFKAYGGVDLIGASIGGNLECDGGHFYGTQHTRGLNANSAKITGSVFLRQKVLAVGMIRFANAAVSRDFQWRDVDRPEKTDLDLEFAKVGSLYNKSRPGKLRAAGFVYEQIDERAGLDAKTQLDWLARVPSEHFSTQPFEQLAKVLRNMGLENDRREVLIKKNETQAKRLRWSRDLEWLWYGLFGKVIGYGYRPWYAFHISLLVIVFGSLLFEAGYNSKLITPGEAKAYIDEKGSSRRLSDWHPRFNALIYSAETFVPLVKLGMNDYWRPNATRHPGSLDFGFFSLPMTGRLLRYYLWFHIIAGWVLTTLWVGGLTGLAKT